ncbi:MAG: hypothetical protein JNM64_20090, partial [Chloroflexia bacterium]|nr:hypothetical protein [Chloroflexia bacterium]
MDKHRFTTRGRLSAMLLVAGAMMKPWEALAQDATPAALGEAIKSQTREEFRAELNEAMGYT